MWLIQTYEGANRTSVCLDLIELFGLLYEMNHRDVHIPGGKFIYSLYMEKKLGIILISLGILL